jgi:hypothetical protein
MSKAARSLFVFGVYVLVVGIAFLAVPETLTSMLKLPAATAGWARMIGLLAVVIGVYDITAARAECLPYVRASIPVRFGFAIGCVLLVVAGQMPVTLLPLAAIDVAGALWTMFVLRAG